MGNEKIKVEGYRRKKRRMKLKAKGNSDAIIEKFSAQSSKSAKFAKTSIKKREGGPVIGGTEVKPIGADVKNNENKE